MWIQCIVATQAIIRFSLLDDAFNFRCWPRLCENYLAVSIFGMTLKKTNRLSLDSIWNSHLLPLEPFNSEGNSHFDFLTLGFHTVSASSSHSQLMPTLEKLIRFT
jgi:hypothetical protein